MDPPSPEPGFLASMYRVFMADPTSYAQGHASGPAPASDHSNLFWCLRHAEELVLARNRSRCCCQRCIIKGDAFAQLLAVLPEWIRARRGEAPDIAPADHFAAAAALLFTMVADFVRMAPTSVPPEHYKVSPEIVLYWLTLAAIARHADGDPVALVLALERDSSSATRFYDIFDDVIELVGQERLPRRCASDCAMPDNGTCFADRLIRYLTDNGSFHSPFERRRDELDDGAQCSCGPREAQGPWSACGSLNFCARLGCAVMEWEGDDGGRDGDAADRSRRRPSRRLKRCAQCKKAFYCSRMHQKESWKVHQLVCDIRRRGEYGPLPGSREASAE